MDNIFFTSIFISLNTLEIQFCRTQTKRYPITIHLDGSVCKFKTNIIIFQLFSNNFVKQILIILSDVLNLS